VVRCRGLNPVTSDSPRVDNSGEPNLQYNRNWMVQNFLEALLHILPQLLLILMLMALLHGFDSGGGGSDCGFHDDDDDNDPLPSYLTGYHRSII